MMSELEALKGLTADSLIVASNADPSVMDPETLRFCTTEQMRKVLTEQFEFYANHTASGTESRNNPKGRRPGTYTIDEVGEALIEDLIVEMQPVVGHDLKTRADEVDSALRTVLIMLKTEVCSSPGESPGSEHECANVFPEYFNYS